MLRKAVAKQQFFTPNDDYRMKNGRYGVRGLFCNGFFGVYLQKNYIILSLYFTHN